MFNNLEILFVGSINSNRSSFGALDISPVNESGQCYVKTLFSISSIQLPMPIKK
jgi:hypothetical protein